MTVQDIISKIHNGTCHIWIFEQDTGELRFKEIWHNKIPDILRQREINKIEIGRYEMRLYI